MGPGWKIQMIGGGGGKGRGRAGDGPGLGERERDRERERERERVGVKITWSPYFNPGFENFANIMLRERALDLGEVSEDCG